VQAEPDQTVEQEDEDGEAFWPVPWHAYVPGAALAAAMALLWAAHALTGGMTAWAVSAAALAEGRFETVALHMLAHAGLLHLLMNSIVLVQIGGPVVARLGGIPGGWWRFLALFVLAGLAGMAVFLAFHPQGVVPMLGASGAIYGLLGLLIRLRATGEGLVPIRSRRMRRAAVQFVKDNLLLFVLLTLPALLAGRSGGVAWEAHLGGFLFGLFAAPLFFDFTRRPDDPA
jgi:membrane associated rhomboid family serine protease